MEILQIWYYKIDVKNFSYFFLFWLILFIFTAKSVKYYVFKSLRFHSMCRNFPEPLLICLAFFLLYSLWGSMATLRGQNKNGHIPMSIFILALDQMVNMSQIYFKRLLSFGKALTNSFEEFRIIFTFQLWNLQFTKNTDVIIKSKSYFQIQHKNVNKKLLMEVKKHNHHIYLKYQFSLFCRFFFIFEIYNLQSILKWWLQTHSFSNSEH